MVAASIRDALTEQCIDEAREPSDDSCSPAAQDPRKPRRGTP